MLLHKKLKLIMRKEHADLIPNCNMAFYHVKIGFRILTAIFTKKPFIIFMNLSMEL
ncbi:hypothetical protein G3A_22275 [Bacillus sp. 17376]|uniref:Uncharacterized protein n=1 Tax=Mesobacillus boroniphilus JCM 21738 TaxID=1294265 RepID=W4RH31_9BACI|nr:hypothetical protein G3A_22275 [Bacillus sp. 17376]GAE43437.1 hypothetical protein JCM21738_72 [Mesobacillus boroniphilus JCM 21738]